MLGDPDRLGQLLANLIRNAVVHTPPGVTIDLSLRHDLGRAVLEVRDHGPGLPPEAGDKVFERFWRAEGGRSRGRAGAGLGLAIVRAIAVAHGGQVGACNATGGGALFWVTLPLAEPLERAQGPAADPDQLTAVSANPQHSHAGLLSESRTFNSR